MFFRVVLCFSALNGHVWLLRLLHVSAAFMRGHVKFKEFQLLHSTTHQCQLQNSGPIRLFWRRDKHCKLLFTVASWHGKCFILQQHGGGDILHHSFKNHSWALHLAFLDVKTCSVWTAPKALPKMEIFILGGGGGSWELNHLSCMKQLGLNSF